MGTGTASTSAWRLLRDGVAEGTRNMAADEALLRACAAGDAPPTFRLYRWKGPVLSVGYFQDVDREIDLEACRALGVGVVRRPTGGKAVLHGEDLSFSVVAAESYEPFRGRARALLRRIGRALIASLKRCGVDAEFAATDDAEGGRSRLPEGPACFQSLQPHEVVVGRRKVAGIAQARRNGGVLVHGAVLISCDRSLLAGVLRIGNGHREGDALRVAALDELLPCVSVIDRLSQGLVGGLEEEFGVSIRPGARSREEVSMVDHLVRVKYTGSNWNVGALESPALRGERGLRNEEKVVTRLC